MTKIRQLCLVSLMLTSGIASAANVRLQVEGLSGALEKNVRAQLSTIQSDEVTPDRRFRARVDDAIREGLKALGYYEPTIDFDLRPPPAKGRQVPSGTFVIEWLFTACNVATGIGVLRPGNASACDTRCFLSNKLTVGPPG